MLKKIIPYSSPLYCYLRIINFANAGSNLPVLKILLFMSHDDVHIGVCLNDILGFIYDLDLKVTDLGGA